MTGMYMPPAPIMGSRKVKLYAMARKVIIMNRKMQAQWCKDYCGEKGVLKKDRTHNSVCLKTTAFMKAINTLMRGI